MKSILFFLISFFVLTSALNAQLNDYKYIIVPKKFNAFKNENEHQTSTLIKYLFVQNGFDVVYEGDYPEDLKNDLCLGVKVDLEDKSSLFRTRTSLVLKDCELKLVFRTQEGTSKLKEFKASYEEAIRKAFKSVDNIDYNYTPKKDKTKDTLVLNFKNDVKSLDEIPKEKVVTQTTTPDDQSFESKEPVASAVKKNVETELKDSASTTFDEDLLYALKTENGYNLADSDANIAYRLLSTSVDDIFLLDQDGQNGVVFKKDGKWYLESVDKGQKVLKELNIKF